MKPNVVISDDYAIAWIGKHSFYYGYEVTKCTTCGVINCKDESHEHKEWCFKAKFDGNEIIIPGSELAERIPSMEDGLLTGIMWLFAKYELKLKEHKDD